MGLQRNLFNEVCELTKKLPVYLFDVCDCPALAPAPLVSIMSKEFGITFFDIFQNLVVEETKNCNFLRNKLPNFAKISNKIVDPIKAQICLQKRLKTYTQRPVSKTFL